MEEEKIITFLKDSGVNEKSLGFNYSVSLIKIILDNPHYTIKNVINYIASEEKKPPTTIKNHLRYAITVSNKYGGRLSIKDLVKLALQKNERS